MSGIYGLLGYEDTDRVFLSTIGQSVIYDASVELLSRFNAELAQQTQTFIEGMTSDFQVKYKLPGGGRMQERAGLSESGAVKATGEWTVAFPLKEFGDQVAAGRKQFAYMTLQDLNRHFDTIFIRAANAYRFEVLRRLLKNTTDSFADPNHGTLTIQPLANGDSVLYPPVLGSESEATESHYLGLAYAVSAISDTNNPIASIVAELVEHFGNRTGGENVAVFLNTAQVDKIEALSDFSQVNQRFVQAGVNTAEAIGLPFQVPGRILGYVNGAWAIEWPWIPAAYMVGVYLDAPAPLMQRNHPADTGLPSGLNLVSESSVYPFSQSHYEYDFGIGAGNRLNGVVAFIDAGGTYTIPAGYS